MLAFRVVMKGVCVRIARWIAALTAVVMVAGFNAGGPAHANPRQATPTVDPSNAESVRAAYRRLQDLTHLPHAWSGNVDSCDPGSTAPGYDAASGEAINIVRAMAGLKPVTFDAELGNKARQASLVMLANKTLTHAPDPSMKCYTADAREAAGRSNLAFGAPGANAILAYMEDGWHNNEPVGHRRWLLKPETTVMGVASTNKTNAVYAIGTRQGNPSRPWVAWPTEGYFPSEMVPRQHSRRWSLSAGAAWTYNFTKAKVSVTDESGRSLPLTVLEPVSGYANDTLVWEMDPPPAVTGPGVAVYTVKVSNIRKGSEVLGYTYQVKLIQGSYQGPSGGGSGNTGQSGSKPVKHTAPQLTSHTQGKYYPAGPVSLAGRGTPGATIRLKLGSRVRTTTVNKRGEWRLGSIDMAAQGFDVKLVSTLKGDVKSSSYALYFGPAPAKISLPVVKSHKQNACHVGGASVRFSGTGTPGSKITLTVGRRTRVAWVRANGRWNTGAIDIAPKSATRVNVRYVVSAPGHSDLSKRETYVFSPNC